jgi:hypothetical protein
MPEAQEGNRLPCHRDYTTARGMIRFVLRKWVIFMARTFFSCLAVLVIIVTSYSVANAAALNLQLRSLGSDFTIQNTGHDPVAILDIVVNDRSECSTYALPLNLPNEKGIQTALSYYETQLKALDDPPDPRYVALPPDTIRANRRTYQGGIDDMQHQLAVVLMLKNTDLHKFWVFGGELGPPFGPDANYPNQPIILQVGDIHTWTTSCNIVRIAVTTAQGSETYSFAN